MKGIYFTFVLAAAMTANAQMPGPPPHGDFGGMRFMGLEGGRPGTVVANAPFSGQQTTTETRTLADGTHITRTTTAQFYRDAQGRTRVERTFTGPAGASSQTAKTMVEIFDPVASVSYFLDAKTLTATKHTLRTPPNGAHRSASHHADTTDQVTTTNLGTQTIQGLSCTGTQTVRVIPAGQIGNDQAISITTQRWYSPDLQMNVETKRIDPMMGEVDSVFQNVTRTAPDASLFAPPSNYTVTTGSLHHPPDADSSSAQ